MAAARAPPGIPGKPAGTCGRKSLTEAEADAGADGCPRACTREAGPHDEPGAYASLSAGGHGCRGHELADADADGEPPAGIVRDLPQGQGRGDAGLKVVRSGVEPVEPGFGAVEPGLMVQQCGLMPVQGRGVLV